MKSPTCAKILASALGVFLFLAPSAGQTPTSPIDQYRLAIEHYNRNEHQLGAKALDTLTLDQIRQSLNTNSVYDCACIYALAGDSEKALSLLRFLIFDRLYSDVNHLKTDPDLDALRGLVTWTELMLKAEDNLRTLPARTMGYVKTELEKAKEILSKDQGALWGDSIWNDKLLILSASNYVYSLRRFPGSRLDPTGIYWASVPPGTFSSSNAVQSYQGREYAVVLVSYLADRSATIIHELFHVLQFSQRKFNGLEVAYLDEPEARILLRAEYQALRNTLTAIERKEPIDQIVLALHDALYFRKQRQRIYAKSLATEIELETLEGVANYTGYKLASSENKIQLALAELNKRESAKSYTRNFPYATGLAYGMIFDALGIRWRRSAGDLYDFTKIVDEGLRGFARHKVDVPAAKSRTNYDNIVDQETVRKKNYEELQSALRQKFVVSPTLSVTLSAPNYTQTTDIDATAALKGVGTVFKFISGKNDSDAKNFGSFVSIRLEKPTSGVLRKDDGTTFVFGMPFRVEGNKIIGEDYEITLAPGWTVKQVNAKGDHAIVRVGQ